MCVCVFTWVQVCETVHGQTLKICTDFQLQNDGTNQALCQQPTLLQTSKWTKQHKTTTTPQHVNLHMRTHEFRLIRLLSPLVSFEQRVSTQTAVCGRRLIEARPAAALLGVLLLVVELLYEAEDVLQLALALGELQTGAQQTDGGVTLLLFLSTPQRLRRVRQNRGRAHIPRGRLEKTHNQRKHDFSSAFSLMRYANQH